MSACEGAPAGRTRELRISRPAAGSAESSAARRARYAAKRRRAHDLALARSLLVTAIGQRSFDPLDTEEIEHCLLWLDGQPEVAGIPADTIRAALASVGPGERFSLLVEEPKAS
jgi:hypothetical protein